MSLIDLNLLFGELKKHVLGDADRDRLLAVPIPGHEQHRLARTIQGNPCLLLYVPLKAQSHSKPIHLANIEITYDVSCNIISTEQLSANSIFTLIKCTSQSEALQGHFLRILGSCLQCLPTNPSRQDITALLDEIVGLLRALKSPPRKAVQGLWTELLVIAQSRDPVLMVSAWHQSPRDRFDFSFHTQHLEVKSTSEKTRQHYFALEQLNPLPENEVLIASVIVERISIGSTIKAMMDEISLQLADHPKLVKHLISIVSLTLGNSLEEALEESFNRKLAEHSLEFYDVRNIPSVPANLPKEVSEVHFKSDLTHCNAEAQRSLLKRGGLFAHLKS